jgi:hypothetical protein
MIYTFLIVIHEDAFAFPWHYASFGREWISKRVAICDVCSHLALARRGQFPEIFPVSSKPGLLGQLRSILL